MISSSDLAGGASRSSFRLFKGLQGISERKAQVRLLVKNQDCHSQKDIIKINKDSLDLDLEEMIARKIEQELITSNRSQLSHTMFSFPYPGMDLSTQRDVKKADIINLHWVSYFQSIESIYRLCSLGKPVVWTLHDQSAFTGGCHYSAGCHLYRQDCHPCPQLLNQNMQITREVLENKKKFIDEQLVIVTPSNWLAQGARESSLFKHLRIEVIRYGLETGVFKPHPKAEAKRDLNISKDSLVILFGAVTTGDTRKGFGPLKAALAECLFHAGFAGKTKEGKITLVTFGHPQEELNHLDIPCRQLGRIQDDETLARVYSAADMFLLPSLEDNLPNTMLEALSCGTPVIGFAVGGIPDLVKPGETGLLAEVNNSRALAEHMIKLVFDQNLREYMSKQCRTMMEKEYGLENQANLYLSLFKDLLKNKKRARSFRVSQVRMKENNPQGGKNILSSSGMVHTWQPQVGESLRQLFYQTVAGLNVEKQVDFYFRLGDLHQKNRDENAKLCYEKSLQLLLNIENRSVLHLYKMGSLYRRLGSFDRAGEIFEGIIKQTNDAHLLGGAYFHLAEMELVKGKSESAKGFFFHCLEYQPGHGLALSHLVGLQMKQWPLASFKGKKITLWGCAGAGMEILDNLRKQGVEVRFLLDNIKTGWLERDGYKRKKIKKPGEIDFAGVDIVLFGILRDTRDLQAEIEKKFPGIGCYSLGFGKGEESEKVIDHVLTEGEKQEFRRNFYSGRLASWREKKEFLVSASTPDIDRCLRAIEKNDFAGFSYGEKYNRLILDMITNQIKRYLPGFTGGESVVEAADVGCVSGLYPAMLLVQGYRVTIFDVRRIDVDVPGLSFEQVDLGSGGIREELGEKFHLVTCISTVEHVGLGRYGDKLDPDGDFKLVQGIREILKPGGLLICSVPVGPGCVVYNLHRVYSPYRLKNLFPGFKLLAKQTSYQKREELVIGDDRYQPVFLLEKEKR